jgi:hypothetical protein
MRKTKTPCKKNKKNYLKVGEVNNVSKQRVSVLMMVSMLEKREWRRKLKLLHYHLLVNFHMYQRIIK